MVLFDSVVGIANSLLGFIPLPGILAQPIISHIYVDIFFIVVFAGVILLSKMLTFKRLALALFLSTIMGILVGGAYFAVMTLFVQLPLLILWKFVIFKKKDELGGEAGGEELGKVGGEEFGKAGGEEELGLPKAEEFKETGMPEFTPESPDIEQPQKKLCPYCHNPLRYIEQYQRYYCDYCKQYR